MAPSQRRHVRNWFSGPVRRSPRRVLAQSLYYIQMQFWGWRGGCCADAPRAVRNEGRALFRPDADDNNNRESDCCRVVGTLAIHPSLSLNTAQRVTTLITRGCCGVLYLQQGRGVNQNESLGGAATNLSISDMQIDISMFCMQLLH